MTWWDDIDFTKESPGYDPDPDTWTHEERAEELGCDCPICEENYIVRHQAT